MYTNSEFLVNTIFVYCLLQKIYKYIICIRFAKDFTVWCCQRVDFIQAHTTVKASNTPPRPRGQEPCIHCDSRGLCVRELAYLRDAVLMGHDLDDIVKRQKRVAFDLGVDVLALSAGGQQLHQVVVVGQSTILIPALRL